jgi:hypothetical protein
MALALFWACASTRPVLLPAGLERTLGSATAFGLEVAEWRPSVGATLSLTELDECKEMAARARPLGLQIKGFENQVTPALAQRLDAIAAGLTELGDFDLQATESQRPEQQAQTVGDLADGAIESGRLSEEFLEEYGIQRYGE